jgi:hypothetical protein
MGSPGEWPVLQVSGMYSKNSGLTVGDTIFGALTILRVAGCLALVMTHVSMMAGFHDVRD